MAKTRVCEVSLCNRTAKLFMGIANPDAKTWNMKPACVKCAIKNIIKVKEK